jgi:hypothetical protein
MNPMDAAWNVLKAMPPFLGDDFASMREYALAEAMAMRRPTMAPNRQFARSPSQLSPTYMPQPSQTAMPLQQTSPAPPPADPEFMARIKADEEESQRRKTEREQRKD